MKLFEFSSHTADGVACTDILDALNGGCGTLLKVRENNAPPVELDASQILAEFSKILVRTVSNAWQQPEFVTQWLNGNESAKPVAYSQCLAFADSYINNRNPPDVSPMKNMVLAWRAAGLAAVLLSDRWKTLNGGAYHVSIMADCIGRAASVAAELQRQENWTECAFSSAYFSRLKDIKDILISMIDAEVGVKS